MKQNIDERKNIQQQYDYVLNSQSKKIIKSLKSASSGPQGSSQMVHSAQIYLEQSVSSPTQSRKVVQYIFLDEDQFKLGQGSYGAVYKCYTKQSRKVYRFALKVIKVPEFKGSITSGQDIIDTTRQQIKTLMKFKGNPNIIKIQDLIRDQKTIYLILEYCNDKDIISYMKKLRGESNVHRAKSQIDCMQKLNYFIAQLLNGFKDLQKNKISHRDIKPGNILVSNGVLKIADFGLSKPLYENSQIMSQFVGTLCTAAPQIKFKQYYTAKCDIYSLGALYYWLIYNRYPYKDIMSKNQYINTRLEFPDLGDDGFIVADQVKKLIRSMLAFQQAQRPDWSDLFNHKFFLKYLGYSVKSSSRITFDRGMTMIQSEDFNLQIPQQFYKYVNQKDLQLNKISVDQYQDFINVMRSINWFNLKVAFLKELMKQLSDYTSKQDSQRQIQEETLCDIIRLGIQKCAISLTKTLEIQITFKDIPSILDRNALKSLKNQEQFSSYSKDLISEINSFDQSQQKPKLSEDKISKLVKKCQQFKISQQFQTILRDSKQRFDQQKLYEQITKTIIELMFLLKPEIKNFHFKKQQLKSSFQESRFKSLILLVHHLNMFVMNKEIFSKKPTNVFGSQSQQIHLVTDFLKRQRFQDRERFLLLSNQIQFLLDRFQE